MSRVFFEFAVKCRIYRERPMWRSCTRSMPCLSLWERWHRHKAVPERALSVSFADSSPKGGAKGGCAATERINPFPKV